MQRHRNFRRGCLLLTIASAALPSGAGPLWADSVPESIRIQEQAEKAYEAHPVVPIDRGNAHHRDSVKDDGYGGGSDYQAVPPLPPAAERHDKSK